MAEIDQLIHLSGSEITAIHDSILEGYAGLKGSRRDLSVDAIVGRVHANIAYKTLESIEQVAAMYAEAIAKAHVFNDGNKRTALVSMLTFLDLNGYDVLPMDQNALADKIVDLAEGKLDFKSLAMWLKPKLVVS